MSDSSVSLKAYKYRLYPTDAQAKRLDFLLWQGRKIYNGALAMRKEAYEQRQETISLHDLRDHWCAQRKAKPETFGLLPFDTVDYLIRRLDKAYKAFFRRLKAGEVAGFPRFKGRYHFNSLEYVPGHGLKLLKTDGNWARLRLMYAGDIQLRYHRPIPIDGKIKYAVIRRDNLSQWWVTFSVEYIPNALTISDKPAVGVDVGFAYLLALSDGRTMDNPRWYRESQAKRRVLMRQLDRQRRANNPQNYNENGTVKAGVFIWHTSNRQRKIETELKRLDETTRHLRQDFWHVVTDDLTRRYSLIALEDLSPDFVIQNKHLAMSAHDAGWSTFRQILEYKARERGVELCFVPPAYTSQRCSRCGHVDADNRQTQANFTCVSCGYRENADVNAARNILDLALNRAYRRESGVTQTIGSNGSNVPLETVSDDAVATSESP